LAVDSLFFGKEKMKKQENEKLMQHLKHRNKAFGKYDSF
jgi:hypothetical protein